MEPQIPLAALVLLKGLDEDGNISYWHEKTDGLTLTEAYGMVISMADEIREELLHGDGN